MIAESDGVVRANNYPRRIPIWGVRPPSTPWTIDLTDEAGLFWIAPFDLDAKRAEDFEQAVEDLGVVVRTLRKAEIPHVVCRSSPTGGFHVFVPVAGVELPVMKQLADAASAVLPSLDHGLLCNARTGAVRPPGAPHARGGFSEVMEGDPELLLTPTVTAADLLRVIAEFRRLRPAPDPAAQPPMGVAAPAHRVHRQLPAWGEAHMATVAGGADPSRTGYLCLLAAAIAGWTFRDVERAARTAPGMEHYRTRRNPQGGAREPRTARDTAARLARQWEKAQERALQYRYAPPDRGNEDLSELAAIVDVAEGMLTGFRVSPGRWAGTETAFHDATVLTALAWLSVRAGSRDVGAALRTLAILTGIPSSTVDRTLRRLKGEGWVTRVRLSEGPDAAVWRVTDRFSTTRRQDGPLHEMTARPPGQLFDARAIVLRELDDRLEAGRHDVFTRDGLGPTARRVYEALRDTGHDLVAVADRAGLPAGRVAAALVRLRRHRLASDRGGWRRRVRDFRDWVARRLGVDGILQRRQVRYERERELWAWWNNHLTRMGGRRGRNRTHTAQTLIFRYTDDYGGPEAWPSYPTYPDGTGDHHTAWRYIEAGLLQQLRDTELAA